MIHDLKKEDQIPTDESTSSEDIRQILEAVSSPALPMDSLFDDDESFLFVRSKQVDTQQPETAYELYYKYVLRFMQMGLNGLQRKDRKIVYEQKSIFLNRGKKRIPNKPRGSDERMAFTSDLETLSNIVYDWYSKGQTAYELYQKIRNLNLSRGYINKADY